jgi:O-methyltransferase
MDALFGPLFARCKGRTATSAARMFALYSAIRFVSAQALVGDIVECGVWRGGSSMLAALTLLGEGDVDRGIYLYDTFEG